MNFMTRTIGAAAVAIGLLTAPTASFAQFSVGIGVNVGVPPPPIPVYEQPPVAVADDLWTPGYWAYGAYGYYWVPGTWVAAPEPGFLWTPGYWAFNDGFYGWHSGYWGPTVGFYGGVNYGFGYGGVGFGGGYWQGGFFHYNTAVTNVNTTVINNTYVNNTVVNNDTTVNRTSYNGGTGGIQAHATPEEEAAANESHLPPTPEQRQHAVTAGQDRRNFASVNNGRPEIGAVAAPLSRENRPEGFEPAKPEDRVHTTSAPSNDPFSRFNHDSPRSGGESNVPSYAGGAPKSARNQRSSKHRSAKSAPAHT